jgi:hypothetical protein
LSQEPTAPLVDLDAATAVTGLSKASLEDLAAAGYLAAAAAEPLRFRSPDLKAFVARNADNGSGPSLLIPPPEIEPDELVALLDARAGHMADRMLKMFMAAFPAAARWSPGRQARFVENTRARFHAILSVAAFGTAVDGALFRDLYEVGVEAARTNTDLPQLLVLLRISRDLVVQNAVELAESDGRQGGFALSLLLTRILPAMDRLADALASGYWETISRS